MKSANALALSLLSLSISDGSSFLVPGTGTSAISNHAIIMTSSVHMVNLNERVSNLPAKSSDQDDKQPGEDMNPVTKASWYELMVCRYKIKLIDKN